MPRLAQQTHILERKRHPGPSRPRHSFHTYANYIDRNTRYFSPKTEIKPVVNPVLRSTSVLGLSLVWGRRSFWRTTASAPARRFSRTTGPTLQQTRTLPHLTSLLAASPRRAFPMHRLHPSFFILHPFFRFPHALGTLSPRFPHAFPPLSPRIQHAIPPQSPRFQHAFNTRSPAVGTTKDTNYTKWPRFGPPRCSLDGRVVFSLQALHLSRVGCLSWFHLPTFQRPNDLGNTPVRSLKLQYAFPCRWHHERHELHEMAEIRPTEVFTQWTGGLLPASPSSFACLVSFVVSSAYLPAPKRLEQHAREESQTSIRVPLPLAPRNTQNTRNGRDSAPPRCSPNGRVVFSLQALHLSRGWCLSWFHLPAGPHQILCPDHGLQPVASTLQLRQPRRRLALTRRPSEVSERSQGQRWWPSARTERHPW